MLQFVQSLSPVEAFLIFHAFAFFLILAGSKADEAAARRAAPPGKRDALAELQANDCAWDIKTGWNGRDFSGGDRV